LFQVAGDGGLNSGQFRIYDVKNKDITAGSSHKIEV
jgi:hypothetical protein